MELDDDSPPSKPTLFERGAENLRSRAAWAVTPVGTALLVLDWVFLSFLFALGSPPVADGFRLSTDLAFGFAWVGLWSLRNKPPRVILYALLASLLVLLRLIGLADEWMRFLFARPLRLKEDLGRWDELVRSLQDSTEGSLYLMLLLATAALAGSVFIVTRGLIGAKQYMMVRRHRKVFAGVGAAVILLYFAGADLVGPSLAVTAVRSLSESSAEHPPPGPSRPIRELGQSSVFLFGVESYGAELFKNPAYRSTFDPALVRIEATLRTAGVHSASQYARAPVVGERPEFSFAAIGAADLQPPLAREFRAEGQYQTVLVLPGMDREWPRATAFEADQTFLGWQLGYQGPRYGRIPVPDTYAFAFIAERVMKESRGKALFVQCALSGGRPPFSHLLPVIDGPRWFDSAAYPPASASFTRATWTHLELAGDSYVQAMVRTLDALAEFAAHRVRGRAVIWIVGLHQPPAALVRSSDPHFVVVHVWTRDRRILDALGPSFRPGLRPEDVTTPPPLGPLWRAAGGNGGSSL